MLPTYTAGDDEFLAFDWQVCIADGDGVHRVGPLGRTDQPRRARVHVAHALNDLPDDVNATGAITRTNVLDDRYGRVIEVAHRTDVGVVWSNPQ